MRIGHLQTLKSKQSMDFLLYLHGNKIAEVGDDFLRVFDGGHQTKTTKSRLNALSNGIVMVRTYFRRNLSGSSLMEQGTFTSSLTVTRSHEGFIPLRSFLTD